jgi:hypothetical protein
MRYTPRASLVVALDEQVPAAARVTKPPAYVKAVIR